jgi:hypothetical protein
MKNVRVVGRFEAMGGSNDIKAIVTDADDFTNWKNGYAARALYSTPKTTVGEIDVPIVASGTYYLAFSNAFALLTDKSLSGEIKLQFTTTQ